MGTAAVAVAGTLLGALIGALSTYYSQKASYRRESDERQKTVRRQVYVDWLREGHQFYRAIGAIWRKHRGATDLTAVAAELRVLAPEAAQVALEHLRLISGEEVAASAARLWAHLRRQPVPLGQDMSEQGWIKWSDHYYRLRRAFMDAARVDLGLPPFDWDRAGVGPGNHREYP